jgi:UDP-glucose 4-epimerase
MLRKKLPEFKPAAVLHFASFIQIGESVREPLKYYRNDNVNAVNLLEMMTYLDINNIILSSSAAVYGHQKILPIADIDPLAPISTYGWSKAFVERVLEDLSIAKGLRYVSLRYVNAAGANPRSLIAELHESETDVIPLVVKRQKERANTSASTVLQIIPRRTGRVYTRIHPCHGPG